MSRFGFKVCSVWMCLAVLCLSSISHAGLITIYGAYDPAPAGPQITYDALVARGTLECSIGCEGLVSSLSSGIYPANVPQLSTAAGWSTSAADLFYLSNHAITTELAVINAFAGTAYTDAKQTSTGGASAYSFTSAATYLLLVMGASPDTFLIHNTSGQEQSYSYTGFSGLGSGLSHVTSVPEPDALTLLGAGLIAIGLMMVRRDWRQPTHPAA
jgi:hypothetical protein